MELSTFIGSIAASMTTIAFIPQVVKIIKTKNTKGISILMYSIFIFGVAMWLLYGVLLNEFPIIIANIVTLALAITVLVLKIIHG